ncbi:acylneuraminate cytidylyltransferase family protein [Fontisubflavum oceani]|uniref:acylneuraminate cytidylyltransferase family protein n=1 Tax=Fontisubflavum oceani TaxID=2978973 RepID=UPI0025B2866D|nr:acylneuraminate cytidylyltransferase family protein [Fontisubflavum oceani]WJY20965.1 acylneuraminate cytidylyltransferase family protein [Fontisubflavum oceani]
MTRAVAIIPIRSGSKGIPHKNIRPIAGRPLVEWTIAHLLSCERIDRVIVSTDSPDYAELCRKAGAEVPYLRPDALAEDTTSTEAVMLDLDRHLTQEGYNYDLMVLAQATSPVRRAGMADACIVRLEETGADSLLTVTKNEAFHWRKTNDGVKALYDHFNRPRRQDIRSEDIMFRETGSLYVTKRTILQTFENRLGGRIEKLETEKTESFEIDDLQDWQIVEAILETVQCP